MGGIEDFWAARKALSTEELATALDEEEGGGIASAFSRSMREAASWSIAAEMVRRNPGRLFVTGSIPIEGVPYDCLRLCRLDIGGWAEINRCTTGSAQRWNSPTPNDRPMWGGLLTQWMSTDDRMTFADAVEAWLELPAPFLVEPAPRRDHTYRVIAAFLASRAFDREGWSIRGLRDVEGYGLYVDEDVAAFLGVPVKLPGPVPMHVLPTIREANVFAICRDDVPVASIGTDAIVRPAQGEPIDLTKVRRGSIAAAVAALGRALG